jgi:hypothetical protein
MADEGRKQDKKELIEILTTIEHRLHFIVSEAMAGPPTQRGFRKEFLELFPGPWGEVEHNFRLARAMIERGDFDWKYIEGLGMAGPTLRWKKRMLDETVRQGVVSRFFKVANSILGSLSKAVPPLEFVKEYKEMVEAAMKFVRG